MPLISSIFSALERLGSAPRELYTFARGAEMWRYTSAGTPVTVAATGLTYAPALITRDRLSRGNDAGAWRVSLTLGRRVPVVAALTELRTTPMAVGIHRYQPATSSVPVLLAFGDVATVTRSGAGVTIELVSGEQLFERPFPSRIIARQCQWSTYSAPCGVPEADFALATTLTTIDRSRLVVASISGHPDGWFAYGQLITAAGDRVHIAKQVGTELHILGALPSDVVTGDAVTLLAGDDKTLVTCRDKFDNVERFLGFDLLPNTDPLQTGLV